jgi:hypothetical protein
LEKVTVKVSDAPLPTEELMVGLYVADAAGDRTVAESFAIKMVTALYESEAIPPKAFAVATPES